MHNYAELSISDAEHIREKYVFFSCFRLPLFVVSQSHQVEVQSNGGHVTGVGTIHGNVDISTCGDSVRTLHSAVIRGQQQPEYRLHLFTTERKCSDHSSPVYSTVQ